ncbi:MAG TPA: TIGR01841 family phasin [Geminicoccaceae bacterium]|nr:TIGR01841 family phasin [Geminicoccaceae bacterium]
MVKRSGGGSGGSGSGSGGPLGDFANLMSQFQVPGINWQELVATQQRNLEAVAKANQVLFEGASAVMRRELEVLRSAMEEAAASSRELMQQRGGDPQASATKRLEMARAAFERAIDNMRELSDLAAKCNREALDVVNRRTLEAFDEMRAAFDGTGAERRGGGAGGGPRGEG